MNMSYKGFLAVFFLASALGLTACDRDKGTERTGSTGTVNQPVEQTDKRIDQGTDTAGKKIDQAGAYMDDAALTAKVKAEIAKDPVLKMSQISVTTTKGKVRLSGAVDSQQSIDRAMEITRNVKEVQATENSLVVKSGN